MKKMLRRILGRSEGAIPAERFEKAYAEELLGKVRRKKPHSSIGPQLTEDGLRSRDRRIEYLRSVGMKPDSIVVDFGCGTMRIGIELMKFLDVGCYVGMDIDRRIISAGEDIAGRDLIESRKPHLYEITDENLLAVAKMRPDIVFSQGVLQHIPPENLTRYFSNLKTVSGGTARVFVSAKHSTRTEQLSKVSWLHSVDSILAVCSMVGLRVQSTAESGDGVYCLETPQ